MAYEAALRPLKSIKALSCYSLNGRPHHELYMKEANLLDYVGEQLWLGGPRCSA